MNPKNSDRNGIVRVYRNLGNKRAGKYSIQTWYPGKGWRVTDHRDRLCMSNVTFVVYEAGRQRVLRTHRKNVHAFAIGKLAHSVAEQHLGAIGCCGTDEERNDLPVPIEYNPYKQGCFVIGDPFVPAGKKVEHAMCLCMNEEGMKGAYIS